MATVAQKRYRQKLIYKIKAGIEVLCGICNQPIVLPGHPDYKPIKKGGLGELTLDHIIPKYLGGKNGLDNMQPAHKRCNSIRGHKDLEVIRMAIDKQTKIYHVLKRMYNPEGDVDKFLQKVAKVIATRDRDAKIAGVRSLVDGSTGYIYEREPFDVAEIIAAIKDEA